MVRSAGVPQVVQFPFQQTIPVQIPIATSNGQTIIQTVHIPIQTLGTAISNTGGLIQGGQIQVIQPQLTQVIPFSCECVTLFYAERSVSVFPHKGHFM